MKDEEIIGNKLKELRKEKGLTLQQVADAFGWNRSTLFYYEKGKRDIGAKTFIKLLEYYNADVNEIVKELGDKI